MSNKRQAPHLLNENPILVYPTLAVELGINKAVVFQQIHFLLNGQKTSNNEYNYVDDRWWVYNSYPEWQRDYFPWLSVSTLKGIFIELENEGLIQSQQSVKNKSDRRKWYTIDYEAWDKKCLTIGQKMSDGRSDKKSPIKRQKVSDGYSKTSSETSTKNNAGRVVFEAVGKHVFNLTDFKGLSKSSRGRIGNIESAARKLVQARIPDVTDQRISELVTAFASRETFKPNIQGVSGFELRFAAYLEQAARPAPINPSHVPFPVEETDPDAIPAPPEVAEALARMKQTMLVTDEVIYGKRSA